ncbi:MAG: NAD(P)-binding protein [Candidatus Nanopelagicales bacterium]
MKRQVSAAVVGGSIGGLTTALLLDNVGFDVTVYERSSRELDGRGGGIVLQPEMLRWFKEISKQNPSKLSIRSSALRYLGPENSVTYEEPVQWRFSSWSTLYRALLADFRPDRYFLDHSVANVQQDLDCATLFFENGDSAAFDFVIFADGITSTGRQLVFPEAVPEYSGYVGWRGTVPENELSPESMKLMGDALGYAFVDDGHICMYPIPGPNGEITAGSRLMNYVYYQNVAHGAELDAMMTDIDGIRGIVSVPPGRVQEKYIREMKKHATETLPPATAELVTKTAQPYIQVIFDVRVARMVTGRIALLGDAAFVARPHAAAGSAKAADDAWALFDEFNESEADIATILSQWETHRLEVGNKLIDRVTLMGRRAQFEHNWVPADQELRFGLKGGLLQPQY